MVLVYIGAESVVYEGILDGRKVAVKKPILSTSEDIDKFHKELQLLWYLSYSLLKQWKIFLLFFLNCNLSWV